MRIAIIHHHLHPGGVTRVIESQVKSLRPIDDNKLTIHTGDLLQHSSFNGSSTEIFVYEPLQYLASDLTVEMMQDQFRKITLYMEQLASTHDILHLHNLNLGKNPLLTLAVFYLAKRGVRIVNHCHDFAEDRLQNYAFLKAVIQDIFGEDLSGVLYPPFPDYHYIVLTSKDYERLAGYSISHDRISLLPNPVTFHMNLAERIPQEVVKEKLGIEKSLKICLYPVRAIHRKNIGEFIMLSVVFREKASWLITQPPRNPAEIPGYERWKDFCSACHIPVIFEAGKAIDFHDLMPAVDFCITTSVMEGFGLVFMEPWLAGVPVIGRNIEYCTADLKRNGIQFPLLYDRFIVTFKREKKDFSDLSQEQQQQVIQDVLLESDKVREVMDLNPFLKDFLNPVKPDIIQNNQLVIQERYSLESYGQQLHGIYKKLSGRA
jgi:glycosyltransferase involved in cell wall biosynthesis